MQHTRLSLGISPCPNDTFIFHALVNNKIDTRGIIFDVSMHDVEALNREAMVHELDITKISTFAYANVSGYYRILDSGAALGFGNGPLLVAPQPMTLDDLGQRTIAIPGISTTANLLLSHLVPTITRKKEMLFSEIENAIMSREVDAGLIIHETRFTYHERGLVLLADLGLLWEQVYQLPVALGCIAIKTSIDKKIATTVNQLIQESIAYAYNNPAETLHFCRQYAQDMTDLVMQQHIDLYVNRYTLSMGELGQQAIMVLLDSAATHGLCNKITHEVFAGRYQ